MKNITVNLSREELERLVDEQKKIIERQISQLANLVSNDEQRELLQVSNSYSSRCRNSHI